MRTQQMPMQQNSGMLLGGGEGAISHVEGMQLKQVDVPVETLLGFANGAVKGAMLGGVVSVFASIAQSEGGLWMKQAMGNLTGRHLLPVLACTTALGGLGALVRYSRAAKHNEWSEKHYNYMMQSRAQSQAQTQTAQQPIAHGYPSPKILADEASLAPLQEQALAR